MAASSGTETNFTQRCDPGRPSTLHDVAAVVGVSPRTVSRVVNDQGGFSEATRTRVLEAVRDLRYRPNVMARGLITRRTKTLAFIAPVLNDPFFPEVAEGVQLAAADAGLTMLFALSNNDTDTEIDVLSRLEAHALDGVIIFPTRRASNHLMTHLGRDMRMVIIDADAAVDHENAACLALDLRCGARLAVDRLVERGSRKLAMISNIHAADTIGRRQAGFVEALPSGMEPIIEAIDPTFEGGRLAAAALLDRHPDVDGIFAYNDLVAIGAIQALQAAGRSVPDDVAVIGCDDIQMGAMVTPSLTTVGVDRQRLGRDAVRTLLALVEGEPVDSTTVVSVDLVVRQSG